MLDDYQYCRLLEEDCSISRHHKLRRHVCQIGSDCSSGLRWPELTLDNACGLLQECSDDKLQTTQRQLAEYLVRPHTVPFSLSGLPPRNPDLSAPLVWLHAGVTSKQQQAQSITTSVQVSHQGQARAQIALVCLATSRMQACLTYIRSSTAQYSPSLWVSNVTIISWPTKNAYTSPLYHDRCPSIWQYQLALMFMTLAVIKWVMTR